LQTRIFVTHSVTYLPGTDYIVVLNKEGGISEAGPYQELISHKGSFAEYIQTYLLEGVDEKLEADDEGQLEKWGAKEYVTSHEYLTT
jgi:hypothetical protein